MRTTELLNTLCQIEGYENGFGVSGNGVFISPSHVLTSWHVLSGLSSSDITFINPRGEFAGMRKGSPYNKKSQIRDLAVVELDQPIGHNFARVAVCRYQPIKGKLATFFNYEARCYDVSYDPRPVVDYIGAVSEKDRIFAKFHCEQEIEPGYSGSPVFNEKGEIVSIVAAIEPDEIHFVKKRNGSHARGMLPFLGPSPADTADFYRTAFIRPGVK